MRQIIAPTSASATIWPATFASPRNHHMDCALGDPRHVVFDGVARQNRLAELRLVDGQKVDRFRLLARRRHDAEHAAGLRHALDHQDAGKYRIAGKMPLKMRLIERDILDADAGFVARISMTRSIIKTDSDAATFRGSAAMSAASTLVAASFMAFVSLICRGVGTGRRAARQCPASQSLDDHQLAEPYFQRLGRMPPQRSPAGIRDDDSARPRPLRSRRCR